MGKSNKYFRLKKQLENDEKTKSRKGGGEAEKNKLEVDQQRVYMSGCNNPLDTGCLKGEPIPAGAHQIPDGSIKMICSNDKCPAVPWLHGDCFDRLESAMINHMKHNAWVGRRRMDGETKIRRAMWTECGSKTFTALLACPHPMCTGILKRDHTVPPAGEEKTAFVHGNAKKKGKTTAGSKKPEGPATRKPPPRGLFPHMKISHTPYVPSSTPYVTSNNHHLPPPSDSEEEVEESWQRHPSKNVEINFSRFRTADSGSASKACLWSKPTSAAHGGLSSSSSNHHRQRQNGAGNRPPREVDDFEEFYSNSSNRASSEGASAASSGGLMITADSPFDFPALTDYQESKIEYTEDGRAVATALSPMEIERNLFFSSIKRLIGIIETEFVHEKEPRMFGLLQDIQNPELACDISDAGGLGFYLFIHSDSLRMRHGKIYVQGYGNSIPKQMLSTGVVSYSEPKTAPNRRAVISCLSFQCKVLVDCETDVGMEIPEEGDIVKFLAEQLPNEVFCCKWTVLQGCILQRFIRQQQQQNTVPVLSEEQPNDKAIPPEQTKQRTNNLPSFAAAGKNLNHHLKPPPPPIPPEIPLRLQRNIQKQISSSSSSLQQSNHHQKQQNHHPSSTESHLISVSSSNNNRTNLPPSSSSTSASSLSLIASLHRIGIDGDFEKSLVVVEESGKENGADDDDDDGRTVAGDGAGAADGNKRQKSCNRLLPYYHQEQQTANNINKFYRLFESEHGNEDDNCEAKHSDSESSDDDNDDDDEEETEDEDSSSDVGEEEENQQVDEENAGREEDASATKKDENGIVKNKSVVKEENQALERYDGPGTVDDAGGEEKEQETFEIDEKSVDGASNPRGTAPSTHGTADAVSTGKFVDDNSKDNEREEAGKPSCPVSLVSKMQAAVNKISETNSCINNNPNDNPCAPSFMDIPRTADPSVLESSVGMKNVKPTNNFEVLDDHKIERVPITEMATPPKLVVVAPESPRITQSSFLGNRINQGPPVPDSIGKNTTGFISGGVRRKRGIRYNISDHLEGAFD